MLKYELKKCKITLNEHARQHEFFLACIIPGIFITPHSRYFDKLIFKKFIEEI